MEQFLNDKRINNTWAIIPIADLPDDFPVLVVNEMPSKSLAEFHLAEYVLIPKGLEDSTRKPIREKIKPEININLPPYHQPTEEKRDTKEKKKKQVLIGLALMKSKRAYKPDPNSDPPF